MSQSVEKETKGGRAFDIVQTILLLALCGNAGWTVKTTIENSQTLMKVSTQQDERQRETLKMGDEIKSLRDVLEVDVVKLKESDASLDHRVTIIETKIKN